MNYPEIEICSSCKEYATFVRDVDGTIWVSVCCWSPAVNSKEELENE